MSTALRQRMIEDMQLRGLAVRTQQAYVQAVQQLALHYGRSPDELDEEDLRRYFLYLKNEKQVSRSTCTQALCGIKFFYETTLGREWKTLALVRPGREHKLPVVLSLEAVPWPAPAHQPYAEKRLRLLCLRPPFGPLSTPLHSSCLADAFVAAFHFCYTPVA